VQQPTHQPVVATENSLSTDDEAQGMDSGDKYVGDQRGDADALCSRIASLKSYYGVLDYDEQQLRAVVSNAVPTECKVIIAVEERRHKKALTHEQLGRRPFSLSFSFVAFRTFFPYMSSLPTTMTFDPCVWFCCNSRESDLRSSLLVPVLKIAVYSPPV
jgi:hypothetical protein